MLIYLFSVFAHLWLAAGGSPTVGAPTVASTTAKAPKILKATTMKAYRIGMPISGSYVETCEATIFCQKGDKYCGGKSVYLGRKVRPSDVGVAHRTLPFGTKLRITNHRTKLSTHAWVIDRGPFGRINTKGKWYNGIGYYRKFLRAKKPIPTKMYAKGVEGWRGCLDMTPAAARAIKLNGLENVTFEVVKWPTVRKGRKRKPNT